MADAVTTQTIQDGDRQVVMKFTNISDGTGESAVTKVDVSTLAPESRTGRVCTEVKINRIFYDVSGMSVDILWDATVDALCLSLSGHGMFDYRATGALPNNAGAGKTGDIAFTTSGATAGDRYFVMLVMTKKYD
ncbi:MAG: hypothetical protein EBV86_02575 [Marivivens sp.]|nr:hypothetical protein [Marivivens sp.]